jgi:hypothetical protein
MWTKYFGWTTGKRKKKKKREKLTNEKSKERKKKDMIRKILFLSDTLSYIRNVYLYASGRTYI